MKIRAKLARQGAAQYLSALDMNRNWERCVRRAGLQIVLSQGFNPHPKFSFASAISVGLTSEAEYVDMELAQPIDPEEFVSRMNTVITPGMQVLEARELPEGKRDALMGLVNAAEYRVLLALPEVRDGDALRRDLQAYLAADTVLIEKETQKGRKTVDARSMTYAAEFLGGRGPEGGWGAEAVPSEAQGGVGAPAELFDEVEVRLLLQTGQLGNLRPEDWVQGVGLVGPSYQGARLISAHRTGLFRMQEDGALISPWEL